MIMHPIIRNRCGQDIVLYTRIGYEDGDVVFAPGVGMPAKIFHHEVRTVSESGIEYTYSTSVHIDYSEVLPEDYKTIHSMDIAGTKYLVKGVSEVRNPHTQKITTLVLKI